MTVGKNKLRDDSQRKLASACHNIRKAQEQMLWLKETFDPQDPRYGDLAEQCMIILEAALDVAYGFGQHAWLADPKKIESWRRQSDENTDEV